MSKLRVDRITNTDENGGPSFVRGATVPSNALFEINGNVNVAGVVTCTGSYSGNGSGLTNLQLVPIGKLAGYRYIIADAIPFRS